MRWVRIRERDEGSCTIDGLISRAPFAFAAGNSKFIVNERGFFLR